MKQSVCGTESSINGICGSETTKAPAAATRINCCCDKANVENTYGIEITKGPAAAIIRKITPVAQKQPSHMRRLEKESGCFDQVIEECTCDNETKKAPAATNRT